VMDGFDPQDLTYTPVEDGWPVGRIILHISSTANYWLHSGILSSINVYRAGESTLANYPTLQSIKSFLSEEHDRTLDLLTSFDMANWERPYPYPDGTQFTTSWIFAHVIIHEIHHRGELSLILGILGREGLDV
jgi:uncharacterized damage-inducible protein DinB